MTDACYPRHRHEEFLPASRIVLACARRCVEHAGRG